MIRRVFVLVAVLCCPAVSAAQIPTVPRYIGQEMFTYAGRSPIEILTQHQTSGDWNKLQAYAREFLTELAAKPEMARLLGNVNENYYQFVWESTNPDGKAVVSRVLVHMRLKPQHAARLPGISYEAPLPAPPATPAAEAKQPVPSEPKAESRIDAGGPQVFDVLLSPSAAASLSSVYVSTPAVDPAIAQLPDVVARVNVLGFAAKALGTNNSPTQILVYVNQPILPVPRAAIKIKDIIATRSPVIILTTAIDTTLTSVLARQARTSACATDLARALKKELDTVAATKECRIATTDCAKAVGDKITAVYAATEKQCKPEALAPVGFDPIMAVEQEFKKLVATAGPKETTGESTLNNTPFTRYSFGVMTGLLIGRTSLKEQRVKVDAGKIANAPLDRALSMVIVNVHPTPYDAEWSAMSPAERFRLFGGTVITPDFGFTAGVGLGVVRGFAINAGAVWLLSDTPKAGEEVGEEPKDKNDPFRSLLGIGGFVGFSYTFK